MQTLSQLDKIEIGIYSSMKNIVNQTMHFTCFYFLLSTFFNISLLQTQAQAEQHNLKVKEQTKKPTIVNSSKDFLNRIGRNDIGAVKLFLKSNVDPNTRLISGEVKEVSGARRERKVGEEGGRIFPIQASLRSEDFLCGAYAPLTTRKGRRERSDRKMEVMRMDKKKILRLLRPLLLAMTSVYLQSYP